MTDDEVKVTYGSCEDVDDGKFAAALKLLTKVNKGFRELFAQLQTEVADELDDRNIHLDTWTVLKLTAALVWIIITTAILPGKKVTAGIIAARLGKKYSNEVIQAAINIAERLQANNRSMEVLVGITRHPLVKPFLNKKTVAIAQRIGKLPPLRGLLKRD